MLVSEVGTPDRPSLEADRMLARSTMNLVLGGLQTKPVEFGRIKGIKANDIAIAFDIKRSEHDHSPDHFLLD
jgi:hypothetical protein